MARCISCSNEIGAASFCPVCGASQGAAVRYAQPAPTAATNGMAIASLVTAFVCTPLGIIFGHVALSQMKRTGENGRGLAIAGLAIGYTALGVFLLFVLAGLGAAV